MISSRALVFPAQRPDPTLPHWLQRIDSVGRSARRERALPLGLGLASFGVAKFLAKVALQVPDGLPEFLPRVVREFAAASPQGLLFGALICALGGGVAIGFWHSIGRWSAAYRLQPADYGRYEVVQGRVESLGWRLRMGEEAKRYRRIHWRLRNFNLSGWSPPVLAEFAELLKPGDVVWIGVDPERKLPPIFLGIDH